jgi:hypothetical protein
MTNNTYSNGKIYKIVNDVDDKIYVGSTTTMLSKRMSGHRSKCKYEPTRKIYAHFNEVGVHNFSIVLIELFPCNSKMELERRERFWIDELKPELNKAVPHQTYDEYYEKNKEAIIARTKEYYHKNIDTVAEKKKQYHINNKESICKRSKDYYENNTEKILQYQQEYRQSNGDKIAEYQKEYQQSNKDKLVEYKKAHYEKNKEAIKLRKREAYALNKAKGSQS